MQEKLIARKVGSFFIVKPTEKHRHMILHVKTTNQSGLFYQLLKIASSFVLNHE
jgi:hypothetical protein